MVLIYNYLFYLYLASNNLKSVEFAGFYIQKVLPSEKKYNKDKTLEEQMRDNMKLSGYSNNNEHILKLFDRTYESSEIIRGMKIKNDGNFSTSAHVLSTEQMNELISKVDKQIDKCIDRIDKCDFNINPKNINNINISCKYCKYKDLCYMTQKDVEEIVLAGGWKQMKWTNEQLQAINDSGENIIVSAGAGLR